VFIISVPLKEIIILLSHSKAILLKKVTKLIGFQFHMDVLFAISITLSPDDHEPFKIKQHRNVMLSHGYSYSGFIHAEGIAEKNQL
jgi:hypothetical protein